MFKCVESKNESFNEKWIYEEHQKDQDKPRRLWWKI